MPKPTIDVKKFEEKFVHQIGQQIYYIEIYLYNQITGEKPFPIPFRFIKALCIEEDFTTWYNNGWFILDEKFENFSRSDKDTQFKPYIFRTDGRNKMSVRICPIVCPNPKKPLDKQLLNPDIWEMAYDFVIYDIEDLSTENNVITARKYYFVDERYQLFSERNIPFSTSFLNQNYNLQTSTDFENSAPARDALEALLYYAGGTVGFARDGTIDKPTIPIGQIDPESFDLGDRGKNDRILYSSPATNNINDDIEYIMDNVVGEDNTPCFLSLGRYSEDKKWKLISLGNYFKNSVYNQIEKIFIEDAVSPDPVDLMSIERAFNDENAPNFSSLKSSRIYSYRFSPMVAADDARICNQPLYHYDFGKGAFTVNFEKNTAKYLVDKFTEVSKSGLYALKTEKTSHVLLNLNKTKLNGLMTKNVYSARTFAPEHLSHLKMMKDALILNEAISFQADGLSFRTPGRFLSISRHGSNPDDKFDHRFLGQWMMMKVIHIFTKDGYQNDIVATKVDSFSKIWDTSNDDGTY